MQCTAAIGETLIGLQQAAVAMVYITDYVLIATVRQAVDGCLTIAGIKASYALAAVGSDGRQTVVNSKMEQQWRR